MKDDKTSVAVLFMVDLCSSSFLFLSKNFGFGDDFLTHSIIMLESESLSVLILSKRLFVFFFYSLKHQMPIF